MDQEVMLPLQLEEEPAGAGATSSAAGGAAGGAAEVACSKWSF